MIASLVLAATAVEAPKIDFAAISPLIALTAGGCTVLLTGLFRSRMVRAVIVPILTVLTLAITIGLAVWQWDVNTSVIEGAMAIDNLTLFLTVLFCVGAIAATLIAVGGLAAEESGHGEFHALLISSVLGMVVLAGSQNLVTLFLGFELLSIPLYVLCATELRRATSLESGLKYLIVGSVGSATLLYGLALVFGATGATDFAAIAEAADVDDVLFLTGVALTLTGLAFKISVAPFHQWTPDVYEGAPTAVTAFMAVATKAAAFGVILRLFDVALIGGAATWAPVMGVLAVITIAVGNVGALGQSSVKRLLAYSSVAQAGYMLAGVVVTTSLGIRATVWYLAAYTVMNLAAFAVIAVRERETPHGDDIAALHGLGSDRPLLAWPMTIAMLALAGFPVTAGFFGKLYLIDAAVDNEYAWLGVAIVLGSAISLAYYLRVVAAVWTRPGEASMALTPAGRPVMAGGGPEAGPGPDRPGDADVTRTGPEEPGETFDRAGRPGTGDVGDIAPERGARPGAPHGRAWGTAVAVASAAATIALGVYPSPLFDVTREVGDVLGLL